MARARSSEEDRLFYSKFGAKNLIFFIAENNKIIASQHVSNGWNPVSETGNDESVVVNDCDINMSRVNPNILVTGTPGVGKTRFASVLKKHLNHVKVINVGDFAKDNNLLGDWDEKYQSHEMKEEELLDGLETVVGQGDGGVVVEHHDPDLFPERWFDLVLVLRCNNTLLYERLTSRGYSGTKLENKLHETNIRSRSIYTDDSNVLILI